MSLTKLSLGGKNQIIPAQEEFVTSRLGTGKRLTLFYNVRRNYCIFKVQPKGGKGSRGAILEGGLEKGI